MSDLQQRVQQAVDRLVESGFALAKNLFSPGDFTTAQQIGEIIAQSVSWQE